MSLLTAVFDSRPPPPPLDDDCGGGLIGVMTAALRARLSKFDCSALRSPLSAMNGCGGCWDAIRMLEWWIISALGRTLLGYRLVVASSPAAPEEGGRAMTAWRGRWHSRVIHAWGRRRWCCLAAARPWPLSTFSVRNTSCIHFGHSHGE